MQQNGNTIMLYSHSNIFSTDISVGHIKTLFADCYCRHSESSGTDTGARLFHADDGGHDFSEFKIKIEIQSQTSRKRGILL